MEDEAKRRIIKMRENRKRRKRKENWGELEDEAKRRIKKEREIRERKSKEKEDEERIR